MPALRPLGDLADGAGAVGPGRVRAGHGDGAAPLAAGQVVHGDLAEGVPGPGGQQQRRPGLAAVEDRVVLQHRLWVLTDQVLPIGPVGAAGIGHRQPSPGRVGVGEHIHPAVPADMDASPRVHALLDHTQRGRARRRGGQVGQVDVVAGRRALGGRDRQPAAVPADRHLVEVRLVPSLPEDERVLLRRGADRVQVDPPVILGLIRRDGLRGQPAHVVEGLPAGQPRHLRVTAAVDGPFGMLPGGHVHDLQHRLLVAAVGDLVGQQPALLVRCPRVEGGGAGRVERHRVDEHPVRLTRRRRDQRCMLLARLAPQEEAALAPPDGAAHQAGGRQFRDPRGQHGPGRQGRQLPGGQRVLCRQPGAALIRIGVFQPAVGVGHGVARQLLHQAGAPGRGIGGPGRGLCAGRRGGCGHERTLRARPGRPRGPSDRSTLAGC